MADTTTPGLGLILPGVADASGANAWGGKLNTDMQTIETAVMAAIDGQCQFVYSSTSSCVLLPKRDGGLVINGVRQVVPAGGISIAATGLTPSTKYYIYAFMNGTTMTLEASTTGYTTDANGRTNKTGDTTRRLVGMVYVTTGPAFQNSAGSMWVRSWFYDPGMNMYFSAATVSVATTTKTPMVGAYPMLWAGETVTASFVSSLTNTVAGHNSNAYISAGAIGAALTDLILITFTGETASYYKPCDLSVAYTPAADGVANISLQGGCDATGSYNFTAANNFASINSPGVRR